MQWAAWALKPEILEPSCGVGNFFGMLPESMAGSRLYGVELDSITGRIAKKLYPKADITVDILMISISTHKELP